MRAEIALLVRKVRDWRSNAPSLVSARELTWRSETSSQMCAVGPLASRPECQDRVPPRHSSAAAGLGKRTDPADAFERRSRQNRPGTTADDEVVRGTARLESRDRWPS